MNDTYVTLVGNAVEDPVRRPMKDGDHFTTFRFASTPWRWDADRREYVDGPTLYATVCAFRGLRAGVEDSVRKGQPLVVHGRLRVKPWSSGEKSGTNVEVEALTVGHDLARGSASFTRHGRAHLQSATPSPRALPVAESGPAIQEAFEERLARGLQPTPAIDPAAADTDEYVVAS